MQVQDAMTRNVSVCNQADSLNDAARLMWEGDCGSIPVVDTRGSVCGIITDRDICMAAYTQGLALRDIPVRDAMARVVHTCAPGDSVEAALALMKRARVRRIPVTDDGRVVGILCVSDLLTVLHSSQSGRKHEESHTAALVDTLAHISKRSDRRDPSRDGASRQKVAEFQGIQGH